jgi:hypothetical protein
MPDDPPKIIVDEDWKSQVEREKAEHDQPQDPIAAGSDTADDPAMPPASYPLFISMLASEAMIALGQIPNPATGEFTPRKNQAKYLIDTLAMLHEKTSGNVEAEEERQVEALLHQLRLEFVRMPAGATSPPPTSSP